MVSSNHDPRQVADLYLDSVLFYKSKRFGNDVITKFYKL